MAQDSRPDIFGMLKRDRSLVAHIHSPLWWELTGSELRKSAQPSALNYETCRCRELQGGLVACKKLLRVLSRQPCPLPGFSNSDLVLQSSP